MYKTFYTNTFNKSYKKLRHSGKIFRQDLEVVVEMLSCSKKLPIKYRDHSLSGEYLGYRECHVKPDLLLIYKIEKDLLVLTLLDIGSHSYLGLA